MSFLEEHLPVTSKAAPTLVNTADAARHIGLAEITLRVWRSEDNPHQPPYVRVGARGVRYDTAALDQWLKSRTHKPGSKSRRKDHGPGRQRGRPGPR